MRKTYSKQFLKRMGALSAQLEQIGERSGMKRGEFIRFVDRVAREKKLRAWADTRDEADYLALIEAVTSELQ